MPAFHYAIAGVLDDIDPHHPILEKALPSDRHNDEGGAPVLCGTYFEAATRFLSDHMGAVEAFVGEKAEQVHIILEKHGAFYHPARIVVNGADHRPLALNVAVCDRGSVTMEREVRGLGAVGAGAAAKDVPEVLATGAVRLGNKPPISCFLAPWFAGYHEFHWSRKSEETAGILVWDGFGKGSWLSQEDTKGLTEQASRILTLAYGYRDFHQIFPWHHAAGDFIVRCDENGVSVRLITVRHYGALTAMPPADADTGDRIEALLDFFWNLSLRMRLDRLDGIGDLFFAPDTVVPAIITGFLDALSEKGASDPEIAVVAEALPGIICGMGEDGVLESLESLVGTYHPDAPDIVIINKNLKRHSEKIYQVFCERAAK